MPATPTLEPAPSAQPAAAPVHASAPFSCAACSLSIVSTYFQVGERFVCPDCRDAAVAAETGGAGGFAPALAWGGLAAVAGAAAWMAITRWSGWEIGLVAIAVGWLVGSGVKHGAGARAGRLHQCLAVALTYFAIVATYVPDVHEGLMAEMAAEGARAVELAPAADAGGVEVALDVDAAQGEFAAPGAPTDAPSPWIGVPLYLAFLFAVAAVLPFLALPENAIGVLILGFALFEAWRLSRRDVPVVQGPFETTPPEAGEAPAPR